jgi:hypothetical protein
MSTPSECEGLWSLIVSSAIEAERDEIARIIGSKRINDNQVRTTILCPSNPSIVGYSRIYLQPIPLQILWQEVKAYNDILSEMHMLEFEDLEERFAPSKDTNSSSTKAQAKSAASSSVSTVPPLTLHEAKTSKISSSSSIIPSKNGADNQQRPSGVGKSSSNSSNSSGHRDEAKSSSSAQAQTQANSPGAISSRSSNSSSSGHRYSDAAEFVQSIQEYLTTDRIAAVLDDIKEAFETERYELVGKRRQLECIMEGDCDVISTNRSGGKSNKSTPRPDRAGPGHGTGPGNGAGNDNGRSHELLPTKSKPPTYGGRSNGTGTGDSSFWDEEDERTAGSKHPSVPLCSACGGDVSDYLQLQELHLSAVPGAKAASASSSSASTTGGLKGSTNSSSNSNSNSSSSSGSDLCLDCRARSRREKKLLSRLPKGMATSAASTAVSTSQEFKSDSFLTDEQPVQNGVGKKDNSKFRNRLQAARDEHHFIEDF